jgi:hypothetical protein
MYTVPLFLDRADRPKVGFPQEVHMRKALALMVVLVLASFASAQSWFQGTLDQAVAKAKLENKLVIVDFYSGG